jgi:hypothetical protein
MLRLAAAAALLAAPLALAADPKPVEPFNGQDLTGWKVKDEKKSHWKAYVHSEPILNMGDPTRMDLTAKGGDGVRSTLVNVTGGGSDIYTEAKFGDGRYEVEFMVPKGSNSGIYLMGEYEVQVLDSYGKPNDKLTQGDLGALYSAAAPKVNAAKKPGEWQSFVIDFRAPKFEGGKKVANARFVKVTLNGTVLHENVEMKGPTPGGLTGKEAPTGPLMFQGDHGPVAYRNIKITPPGK